MTISHPVLPRALMAPELDSVFWTPSRTGVMSAWWGHVPFAHWVAGALRPRLLVELGTHNGVSFAAFCEAMQRLNVDGRCYAVDTWQGDEHAGIYDESVYRDFSVFNKAHYSAFAELMRMTFDEAVPYFADGSIDLLHIDGLHTYDAVKADYTNWLPKLSDRAVVLFHDINVRERGFGVWALWDELKREYPSFEFRHSHGLGVLAVGKAIQPPLAELCALDNEAANLLRDRFAQLGTRWVCADLADRTGQHADNLVALTTQQGRSLSDHKTHVANLEAERARVAHEVKLLQKDLAERGAAIAVANEVAGDLGAQVNALQSRLHAESLQAAEQASSIAAQTARIAALEASLTVQTEQTSWLRGKLEEHAARDISLRAELNAVYASRSWRITAPMRAVKTLGRSKPAVTAVDAQHAGTTGDAQAQVTPQSPDQKKKRLADLSADPDYRLIAGSGLFDSESYAGGADANAMGLNAIAHYMLHGEAAGIRPSDAFDPVFYRERHPDVYATGVRLLPHYLQFGKAEGRAARPMAESLQFPRDRLKEDRETVVVAIHEATRTGAAILAWNIIEELQKRYNVVALLKRGGAIEDAIERASCGVVALPDDFIIVDAETDALARKLVEHYAPKYVITNSVETRYFVPSLERAGIPTVSLIHEFASTVRPPGAMHGLFQSGSQIVFSARIVAESALEEYRNLAARDFKILPQGASRLPPSNPADELDSKAIREKLQLLPEKDGTLLVVGIGTITIRKGVEFFIAAAAGVQRLLPDQRVRFAWVGKCYDFDQPYLDYLHQQIKRSGVTDAFEFLGEFDDLEPIYARADIFFLSSRLDPLPNVTIDSAVRGIPTICFDEASGMVDLLQSNERTRELVVPYLDSDAAARCIVKLAQSPELLLQVSQAMRDIAHEHFDMVRYVASIDQLGSSSARRQSQAAQDREIIAHAQAFNANLYLGPTAARTHPELALTQYLQASALASPRGRPHTGLLVRRPTEGFHPLIYASECPTFDELTGEDPLANYIRGGSPEGRWHHQVLAPSSNEGPAVDAVPLRVAVHGHFHYPDLLPDFLDRLQRNRTQFNLLLTTTSEERKTAILATLSKFNMPLAQVEVVPNKGRDIGPLLSAYTAEQLGQFDVIGHFHGKRSPHVDSSVGDTWREFLWGHLLAGEHLMMDRIIEAFHADPTLGLVFAEDPHLNDWDQNRLLAEALSVRMGRQEALPNHFDFPQGTMFWARPAALRPLLDLHLNWDEYPDEPLPIDGTLLHALERMVPFAAEHAGYRFATTHVPGLLR